MMKAIYFDMAYNNAAGQLSQYEMLSCLMTEKANDDGDVLCDIAAIEWMPEYTRGINISEVRGAYVPRDVLTDADAFCEWYYEDSDDKGFSVSGFEHLYEIVNEVGEGDLQMAVLARRFAQLVTDEDPSAICPHPSEMRWRIERRNGKYIADLVHERQFKSDYSSAPSVLCEVFHSMKFSTLREAQAYIAQESVDWGI